MNKKIYAILLFALLLGVSGLYAQALVILHSNDTHSQIEPQTVGENKGLGGYERRENYIEKVRKEYPNVLLMDAGDYSQGTPYFTLFKGDVEIELMNALGYDVATIGNHEFDNGTAELARRVKMASFPIVCANYDFTGTALEGIIKPYTVIEKGGLKIGVIGVLTDIMSLVSPKNVKGIKYIEPYNVVNKLASKLKKKEKCDLVILLSHLGFDGGSKHAPSDDMVAAQSKDIDIIIGGHSHTYITEKKLVPNKNGKDVVIVTANEKGNYVGKLDLYLQ